MIVTVQAQHLPVAAIFRVVGMIVIDMMDRQFAKIGIDKLAGTAAADPREEFQRLSR